MEKDADTTRRNGLCSLGTACKRALATITKARLAATKAAPNSASRSRPAPGGGYAGRRGEEAPNYREGTNPAASRDGAAQALNSAPEKAAGSREAAGQFSAREDRSNGSGTATAEAGALDGGHTIAAEALRAHPLAIPAGAAIGITAGALAADWLLLR